MRAALRLLIAALALTYAAPLRAQNFDLGGVNGVAPITSAQVIAALGYTPANGANYCALAGCTFNAGGNITMPGVSGGGTAGSTSITMGGNSGASPAFIQYGGVNNDITYSVGRNGSGSDQIWRNVTSEMARLKWVGSGAMNFRIGQADVDTGPAAQILSVTNALAGGTSNVAGANLTIAGGQGKGTGAPGAIILQVAPAGNTGTVVNALANNTTFDGSGLVNVLGTIQLKAYTVSTLPATAALGRVTGGQAYVTDAVACTFLATVTGGGSAFCPVVWNGSNWQGG